MGGHDRLDLSRTTDTAWAEWKNQSVWDSTLICRAYAKFARRASLGLEYGKK